MSNHKCPKCGQEYRDNCLMQWYDKPHEVCPPREKSKEAV